MLTITCLAHYHVHVNIMASIGLRSGYQLSMQLLTLQRFDLLLLLLSSPLTAVLLHYKIYSLEFRHPCKPTRSQPSLYFYNSAFFFHICLH